MLFFRVVYVEFGSKFSIMWQFVVEIDQNCMDDVYPMNVKYVFDEKCQTACNVNTRGQNSKFHIV